MARLFEIGPDGLLLALAMLVSIVVAALAWKRVGLSAAAAWTAAVACAGAIGLMRLPNSSHPVLAGLFVIVPSAILLGASRVRWLAQHAWMLLLVGPFVFIGCYVGICEFCVKTKLI
jgi:hypothetical protein